MSMDPIRPRIAASAHAPVTVQEAELFVEAQALREQIAEMKREFAKERAIYADLLQQAQTHLKRLGRNKLVTTVAMLAWPLIPQTVPFVKDGFESFCRDLAREFGTLTASMWGYVEEYEASLCFRSLIAPYMSGKELLAVECKFKAAWSSAGYDNKLRSNGESSLTRKIDTHLEPLHSEALHL